MPSEAEGPASLKARALYKKAVVLQRIGRTEEAIRTLERLAKEYPGEAAPQADARARLAEWTAVDLKTSFAEWYQRYQYSPEFQAKIVDLVLKLGQLRSRRRARRGPGDPDDRRARDPRAPPARREPERRAERAGRHRPAASWGGAVRQGTAGDHQLEDRTRVLGGTSGRERGRAHPPEGRGEGRRSVRSGPPRGVRRSRRSPRVGGDPCRARACRRSSCRMASGGIRSSRSRPRCGPRSWRLSRTRP